MERNDSRILDDNKVTCFTHYKVNLRQTLELTEEAFCKVFNLDLRPQQLPNLVNVFRCLIGPRNEIRLEQDRKEVRTREVSQDRYIYYQLIT